MATLLSAVSPLNGTFMAQNAGEGFCSSFYGSWPNSRDCTLAIQGLERGASLVDYTVHQHTFDKHDLPFHVQYGMWNLVQGTTLGKMLSLL